MIPDSKISKCPEFEAKSKIGKIFKKHNPIEEYSVRIYEIDPYFYEHYEKKYKLIKMGVNIFYLELMFILTDFYWQQKLMKKIILTEILFLRKKGKNHQKKKLGCEFIRINTSNAENGYDLDYEVNGIEAFIDEFQNKKIKEVKDENKELKDKNKELEEKLKKIEKKLKEKKNKKKLK